MKNQFIIALMLLAVLSACEKDEEEPPVEQTPVDITQLNNGVTTGQYAPFTTGSTFDYRQVDMNDSVTFPTWTVFEEKKIGGVQYIEIGGFVGAADNGYFNCENGEYTVYMPANDTLPEISMVYLKEGVAQGTEWEELVTIDFMGFIVVNKYVYSYVGPIESKIVDGTTYDDILHIHLDTYTIFMGIEQLASREDYYWAKGVGLIEKAGDSGELKLLSYNIQ